jgi:hypothetical protein
LRKCTRQTLASKCVIHRAVKEKRRSHEKKWLSGEKGEFSSACGVRCGPCEISSVHAHVLWRQGMSRGFELLAKCDIMEYISLSRCFSHTLTYSFLLIFTACMNSLSHSAEKRSPSRSGESSSPTIMRLNYVQRLVEALKRDSTKRRKRAVPSVSSLVSISDRHFLIL